MRGSHDGSFEVAHELALAGETFDTSSVPISEAYDLVIVGAGISGLTAAYLAQAEAKRELRILIIDNHDDFGGHAKRLEIETKDGISLGYGGSEMIISPRGWNSDNVTALFSDLGFKIEDFETRWFNRTLYPDLGLSRGTFFNKEEFGVDKLVIGDPIPWPGNDIPSDKLNGRSLREFVSDFPIAEAAKQDIIRLHEDSTTVTLADLGSDEDRAAYLQKISYTDFLKKHWGVHPDVFKVYQRKTMDWFVLPPDRLSAYDCWSADLPGFSGITIPPFPEGYKANAEPYIYHFPDGNATIARLLVRRLVPGIAPGATVEDVIMAPFDYGKLDLPGNKTRIRLKSVVTRLENRGDGKVSVGYVTDNGSLQHIEASVVICANWNAMLATMVPELQSDQREALLTAVKKPVVYTKVAVRNWEPFIRAKVHDVYAPHMFFNRIKLNYPVSIGDYTFQSDPAKASHIQLSWCPLPPEGEYATEKERVKAGRAILMGMTFDDFEREIRAQLQRMFGPYGFDEGEDITAIIVNRWPHAYAPYINTLYDDESQFYANAELAAQPIGRIIVSGSDSTRSGSVQSAIDAAYAAIEQIKSL
jgi:spermidine dehydrogenase